MKDCFTPAKRSEVMSRVRQKDTKPEILLRKALWSQGVRYRKQYKVGGTVIDVAIPGKSVAIFVDGCFWHGCPAHYVEPVSNAKFWKDKLLANRRRDARSDNNLAAAGWRVLRVWECEVDRDLVAAVQKVCEILKLRSAG